MHFEKVTHKPMNYRAWVVLTCMILFFLPDVFAKEIPSAQNGVIDLRDWNFDKDGPVDLKGTWSFYWEHFLDQEDIDQVRPSTIINSPGMWRQGELDGEPIPRIGYGTMRLRVLLGDRPHNLMLNIPAIMTSYELDVNGKTKAKRGIIGRTEILSEPQFGLQTPIIFSDTSVLDIIVRVSDFDRGSGGILHAITLGNMEDILFANQLQAILEWFLVGILFFCFIYHLGLFLMRPKDDFFLFFALFCLAFVFRLLTRGHKFLFDIFPLEWWMLFNRIEFISFIILPGLYLIYFSSLFKNSINQIFLRFFLYFVGLQVLATLLMPSYWHSYILPYYQTIGFLVGSYTLYVSWILTAKGNKIAQIFFVGHLILFFGIIHDILHFNFIFRSVELLGYLSIVFILIQIYALAKTSTTAFAKAENLSVSLNEQVYEQTEQLKKANLIKGKLLSVISHDLRSPLTSLDGYLKIMNSGNVNGAEDQSLIKKLRQSLNESTNLLDNMLTWASAQMESNKLEPTIERLKLLPIAEEAVRLFEDQAQEKNVLVKNFISEDSVIYADRIMIRSVIRNLLSNAIKFTPEGGTIRVTGKTETDRAIVSVVDSGIGLPEEIRDKLFEITPSSSRIGTASEKGVGVGLVLCKDFISQMGGEIWVEERDGGNSGTVFSFSLPNREM